jgi:signal transduction histidine kinase
MSRIGRIRWLALPVAVGLASLEWLASPRADRLVLTVDILVGLAFLVGSVFALGRRVGWRIGVLAFAVGTAWYIGSLAQPLALAYLGPLAHLLITYPSGQLIRQGATVAVVVSYLLSLLPLVAAVDPTIPVLILATGASALPAGTGRRALRRGRLTAILAGGVLATAAVTLAIGGAAGALDLNVQRSGYALVLAVVAVVLSADLRWGGWSDDALARLVIDLGESSEPVTLRGLLAEALDDPTLEIAYRSETSEYLDETGRPVTVPLGDPSRRTVPLVVDGADVGLLIHDARASADQGLAAGISAAAELALANVRLNAAARRRLHDLESSQQRLIEAAELERARIRAELDASVVDRLRHVRERLTGSDAPEALAGSVSLAIADLDALTTGLGAVPALSDGLGEAIRQLATRSALPIVAEVPSSRWPEAVERALFFVASEALTNVVKHARATQARVVLREDPATVTLDVEDDGVGGATIVPGSGIEGLRQRVETIGGELTVTDRPGGGTRLRVVLPVYQRAASVTAAAATV